MKYPIYVEHGFGIHKIEDSETYIQVNPDNGEWDEGIVKRKLAGNIVESMLKNGNRVSEASFNNAFQKALTKINEIASDQLGVEDWSTDQERIEAQDRSRELEDGVEEDFATMWRVGK